MKYFKEDKTENKHGIKGIILDDYIFSIAFTEFNKVVFREECDGYFCKEFTKKESIEILEEAIKWIKEQK